MDRSRPLWELHLVDGLQDGRIAVIPKMHHALVDGMAALGAIMLLVDATPEPTPIEAPAEPWTPRPYDPKRHVAKIATSPIRRARRWTLEASDRLLELRPRTAAERPQARDRSRLRARARPPGRARAAVQPADHAEPLLGVRRRRAGRR